MPQLRLRALFIRDKRKFVLPFQADKPYLNTIKLMKKIFLPLIGVSLITIISAFSSYDNEEEYDNDIVSDTIVNDKSDTVMTIKNIPAEEWAD